LIIVVTIEIALVTNSECSAWLWLLTMSLPGENYMVLSKDATATQRAIGLFSTRAEAESAMHKLRDAGFNMDHVSVVAQNNDSLADLPTENFEKDKGDQAKGGAGAGATAGAVTGGALGLAGSLGVLAIPGIGPAAELGFLLANTLLGGGIGAAGGGLLGALIGWGIPEEEANYYNSRVYEHNDYLVLVQGDAAEIRSAEAIVRDHGIRDWNIYGTPTTPIDNHGTGQVRPY